MVLEKALFNFLGLVLKNYKTEPIQIGMSDVSVNELLAQLHQGFLEDLPARIDKIEAEIMSSHDSDTFDELFRMVHSLKGSAGTYNFYEISNIAHSMEDVMMALMQKQQFSEPSTVQTLLQYIDLLRATTESLISSKSAPRDLEQRLANLRQQVFGEKIKVLVVEPSKLYASLIEHSLEGLSIDFTFVSDGMQGLENLLINQYDLLICSLETPRLNGDALAAALRLVHNFNKGISVFLITSRARENIANQGDFDAIFDRKEIKDGGLSKLVKKVMADKP